MLLVCYSWMLYTALSCNWQSHILVHCYISIPLLCATVFQYYCMQLGCTLITAFTLQVVKHFRHLLKSIADGTSKVCCFDNHKGFVTESVVFEKDEDSVAAVQQLFVCRSMFCFNFTLMCLLLHDNYR